MTRCISCKKEFDERSNKFNENTICKPCARVIVVAYLTQMDDDEAVDLSEEVYDLRKKNPCCS